MGVMPGVAVSSTKGKEGGESDLEKTKKGTKGMLLWVLVYLGSQVYEFQHGRGTQKKE